MALDAATLQRLATMPKADAIALLSGIQDLQQISVQTQQGEGSATYSDATGAGLRAVTANSGEGVSDPQVTGFQKILTPDLEGAADVKGRARFVGNYDAAGKLTGIDRQDVGLSGGYLADHIETIGPLVVALAAGAGALAGGGGGGATAGASAAPGAATAAPTLGAGAETGAAIAGIDQVAPVAATGGGAGAGTAAAGGGSAAAAPSLLERIAASPIAQQAAGMMLGSAVATQMAKPPASADIAPTPAPAAPMPSPAATQPELKPIYASLSGTADTPMSTFLTGPGGIDATKLRLGRNVLLGAR